MHILSECCIDVIKMDYTYIFFSLAICICIVHITSCLKVTIWAVYHSFGMNDALSGWFLYVNFIFDKNKLLLFQRLHLLTVSNFKTEHSYDNAQKLTLLECQKSLSSITVVKPWMSQFETVGTKHSSKVHLTTAALWSHTSLLFQTAL